jgi:type II secretory pathway component PulF
LAVFAYKATDPGASRVRGVLTADSPRQARDVLRAKGLTIQEIVPRAANGPGRSARISARHSAKVVQFIRDLAMLLGAGIPLLQAIDTISSQHRGEFHSVLVLLRDRIASGGSLADAMCEQPGFFDEMCLSVTEVGEASGSLESVLSQLADFKERSLRFKNRVATALAYPLFVLTMAIAVGAGLMTFVIPKLLESLTESGRPLPWSTRVVKNASDLLVYHGWMLLLGTAVLAAAIVALFRTPAGRMRWHQMQLRIPVLGPMIRKQATARVAIVIATMMKSGIVFVRALQIAQRSTPNLAIRTALERCEAAVGAGQDISKALQSTGAFAPVVVQIFAVGQQSGRLEEMLERLAADYDQQVALTSERLTALLEPALILLLVGLIALIACATILPMLEAADVV